jgi:hypothetical protein
MNSAIIAAARGTLKRALLLVAELAAGRDSTAFTVVTFVAADDLFAADFFFADEAAVLVAILFPSL